MLEILRNVARTVGHFSLCVTKDIERTEEPVLNSVMFKRPTSPAAHSASSLGWLRPLKLNISKTGIIYPHLTMSVRDSISTLEIQKLHSTPLFPRQIIKFYILLIISPLSLAQLPANLTLYIQDIIHACLDYYHISQSPPNLGFDSLEARGISPDALHFRWWKVLIKGFPRPCRMTITCGPCALNSLTPLPLR